MNKMKTLKSIVISLALGYGALACSPDVTNNYNYGTGKSGAGGSYTCQDAFSNEVDCIIAIENGLKQRRRPVDFCSEEGYCNFK